MGDALMVCISGLVDGRPSGCRDDDDECDQHELSSSSGDDGDFLVLHNDIAVHRFTSSLSSTSPLNVTAEPSTPRGPTPHVSAASAGPRGVASKLSLIHI